MGILQILTVYKEGSSVLTKTIYWRAIFRGHFYRTVEGSNIYIFFLHQSLVEIYRIQVGIAKPLLELRDESSSPITAGFSISCQVRRKIQMVHQIL